VYSQNVLSDGVFTHEIDEMTQPIRWFAEINRQLHATLSKHLKLSLGLLQVTQL